MESILSLKLQRRPLTSLLSLSLWWVHLYSLRSIVLFKNKLKVLLYIKQFTRIIADFSDSLIHSLVADYSNKSTSLYV